MLLGGCRSADDEALVDELKALAKELGIQVRRPWACACPLAPQSVLSVAAESRDNPMRFLAHLLFSCAVCLCRIRRSSASTRRSRT